MSASFLAAGLFVLVCIAAIIYLAAKPSAPLRSTVNPDLQREVLDIQNETGTYGAAGHGEGADRDEPVFDQEALRKWYLKNAGRHRKGIRSNLAMIRGTYIFSIVASVAMLFMFPGGDSGGLTVLLFVNIVITGGLLMHYYSLSGKTPLDKIPDAYRTELSRDNFPAIWQQCDQLMSRMPIAEKQLRLFYIKNDTFNMHVSTDTSYVYLFLSRPTIAFSVTHNREFRSILGHEFGHVIQGDDVFMKVNQSWLTIPAVLGGINFGIALLSSLASGDFHGGLSYTTGITALTTYTNMRTARRRSELYADTASLAFVDGSSITNIVSSYLPEKGSADYPSRTERMKYLSDAIAKFSVVPVAPQGARNTE